MIPQKSSALSVTGNDLVAALLNVRTGIDAAPMSEPEVQEWSDGDTVYRRTEDGYTATLVEHDGFAWSDRVTGRGATIAKAQTDLLLNKLPEFNDA